MSTEILQENEPMTSSLNKPLKPSKEEDIVKNRIVILENNSDYRHGLERLLKEKYFQVIFCESIDDLLRDIARCRISIRAIIMDFEMAQTMIERSKFHGIGMLPVVITSEKKQSRFVVEGLPFYNLDFQLKSKGAFAVLESIRRMKSQENLNFFLN